MTRPPIAAPAFDPVERVLGGNGWGVVVGSDAVVDWESGGDVVLEKEEDDLVRRKVIVETSVIGVGFSSGSPIGVGVMTFVMISVLVGVADIICT